MPDEGGSTATTPTISNQLASLVPSFDPAEDNVEIWTSKVTMLTAVWPQNKLAELAARLVLSSKGTAFQKLQLHRREQRSRHQEDCRTSGVKSH